MVNISILLTTTVKPPKHISWLKQRDKDDRLNMYIKKINKWLNNTNLNIVVIENSGYDFINFYQSLHNNFKKRIEFISFDNDDIPLDDLNFLNKNVAKGQHELFAINYAYNKSNFIKQSNYIIKITGRYFIPELENILNNKLTEDNNFKILRQSKKWRGWNRCEIVGCHESIFKSFFLFPAKDDMVETEYMNRGNVIGNIYELPEMKLDEPTMQGVGVIQKTL